MELLEPAQIQEIIQQHNANTPESDRIPYPPGSNQRGDNSERSYEFASLQPDLPGVANGSRDSLVEYATPTLSPDPSIIRILSRVSPNSSASAVQPPPGVPNESMQPSRPAQLPGPFTGLPLPAMPLPPSVFGLPDPSATSGDSMDDWFARWVKPFMEQ